MLKKTKINQKLKNVKFCFLIQQQAFFFKPFAGRKLYIFCFLFVSVEVKLEYCGAGNIEQRA